MKEHAEGKTCPLLARLSKLEEFTHELSNWVGLTMNSLIMADRQRDRWYDHMAVATGLAVRATSSLSRNFRFQLYLRTKPTPAPLCCQAQASMAAVG